MSYLLERRTYVLLLLFVALDLIATYCYHLYQQDILTSRFFNLGRDRGLFEVIEYGKFFLLIGIFQRLWHLHHAPIMKAWSLLFIVMLVDNAVGLHEELGKLLDNAVALPTLGLGRSKDVAELLIIALMEGSAFLYLLYHYYHAEPYYKRFSNALIIFFGFLAAGSITLDAIHSRFEEPFEVVGMTCLVCAVHFAYRKEARRYSEGFASQNHAEDTLTAQQ